jgi:hypothetical protein
LPIIEEAEAEEEDDEEQMEVIANEHTISLSTSPCESRLSSVHCGSPAPMNGGVVITSNEVQSLSSSPRDLTSHCGGATMASNEGTCSTSSHSLVKGPINTDHNESHRETLTGDIEVVSVAEDSRQCSNSDLGESSSEEILSSMHTSSTSCLQSLPESSEKVAGIESTRDCSLDGSGSEDEPSSKESALLNSQSSEDNLKRGNSAITLDEGIASNSASLTSMPGSLMGENSTGSEIADESEVRKGKHFTAPSCLELEAQERIFL